MAVGGVIIEVEHFRTGRHKLARSIEESTVLNSLSTIDKQAETTLANTACPKPYPSSPGEGHDVAIRIVVQLSVERHRELLGRDPSLSRNARVIWNEGFRAQGKASSGDLNRDRLPGSPGGQRHPIDTLQLRQGKKDVLVRKHRAIQFRSVE